MKIIIYIFIGFLLLATPGKGQLFSPYNFKFTHYTTQNGLVHNFTRKVKQDSKGFLWIITQNGLSRFDGLQFRNYQHLATDSTSLPFNDLLDMDIDDQDRVWLGYQGGLCFFDPVTKKFHRISGADQASSIVFDRKHHAIWFNSRQTGLHQYNIGSKTLQSISRINSYSNVPYCMSIDSSGVLWIGVERGPVLRYNTNTGHVENTDGCNWARSFTADPDGTMWVSVWGNPLYKVIDNKIAGEYPVLLQNPVLNSIVQGVTRAPAMTGDSILWVITHNAGLALLNTRSEKIVRRFRYNPNERSGLMSDFNSSIYTGRDGVVWICSWFGLTKVNPMEQQFQSAEVPAFQTDLYNLFSGIADDPYDRNVAWMSVSGLGIAKFDKQNDKVIHWYHHDMNKEYDWVWTIGMKQDSFKVLWTCTYGGLISINKGVVTKHVIKAGDRFTYTDGFIYATDGNLWLWSDEGMICFNPISHDYSIYTNTIPHRSSFFKQADQFDDHTLVVAADDGLYKFDITTHRFIPLPTVPGSNRFYAVQVIGNFAYAGGDQGLFRFDLVKNSIVPEGEEEGIISLAPGSLLKDRENTLWIYALNGLYRYYPMTASFKKFTVADGVYYNSSDRAQLFNYGDKMYVGYRMAYTRFDPAKVDVNKKPVQPLITDISLNGNSITFSLQSQHLQELSMRHDDKITFEFTGIDFTGSDRIRFAYMLEGFDADWIPAGVNRSVSYSNLRGGSYTFKVKARNSNGIWTSQPLAVKLKVTPPLAQRWWFRVVVAVAITVLLLIIYKTRIRRIRNKQQEKTLRQQLEIDQYKQQLELEQISSFFSNSLMDKMTVPEVLNDVARNLIGKLGFEDCMIYLWNPEKTKLIQYGGYGVKGEIDAVLDKEKYNIDVNKGIVGATASSGLPILINDTSKDPRYISADNIIRQSELCVPVIDKQVVIGAINIEHSQKNFFTQRHLQTVSTIAALVANKINAIESTQALYQKEMELSTASKKLTETELAMLRSQMNPHFIFNSLNSIQKYIWENKEEDAAEYLASFAKLMRAILENSGKEFIPLRDEISIIKLYIDLEHRRSNARFEYLVRVDESIDQDETMIPPLLMQPFIENAIWHGLNKKSTKGHLLVSVEKEDKQLVCVIDDDGVGRNSSSQSNATGRKSMGIDITRQRIERIMTTTNRHASVEIFDKFDNDRASGTRVSIRLPIQTQSPI